MLTENESNASLSYHDVTSAACDAVYSCADSDVMEPKVDQIQEMQVLFCVRELRCHTTL